MQHGLFAVEQVVIGLDLKFVVVIPVVAPATQHVERQKIGVEILGASHCRGGLHHEGDALPYTATAHIAQKGQMVRWAAFDICAEADALHVPVIPHGLVACSGGATPIHSLRIEAKSAPGNWTTVTKGQLATFTSCTQVHEGFGRRGGRSGHDVDNAVDRVGTPQTTPRTSDDLEPLDIFHQHALRFPENAGEQGGVDAATVDEHEQLVGEQACKTSRRDDPLVRIDLSHLKTGSQSKGVRQRVHADATQLVTGEYRQGGGRLGDSLRTP